MDKLAQDILALVATPSETGHEAPLADLLERRLQRAAAERGHRLTRDGDSLVLRPLHRAPARPLVVLAGHIDTVPRAQAPEPELRDGRIVGRGSVDMKSGIAILLSLAEGLNADEGFADRAFVFYAGEEGSNETNALGGILEREGWLREAGLAILLEPTNSALELGCNGSIHLGVTFHGQACHSARPWQGVHPLARALPWIEGVLRHPIRLAEIEGVVFRETVSLTKVHAGEVRNVVPGTLDLNVNLRYPPDRSPEEAEALIWSLVAAGDGPGLREYVTAEILDHAPAGRIDAASPLYRYLCEWTGLPRCAKQGWTDVARFTSAGVPALNWGPGNPDLCHTRDESVEVAEVAACRKLMMEFLRSAGPTGGALPGTMPPGAAAPPRPRS